MSNDYCTSGILLPWDLKRILKLNLLAPVCRAHSQLCSILGCHLKEKYPEFINYLSYGTNYMSNNINLILMFLDKYSYFNIIICRINLEGILYERNYIKKYYIKTLYCQIM